MTKTSKPEVTKPPTRHRIRAFLQRTGGAGKTTVAVVLAQHINAEPGRKALPVDVDPEAETLANHKSLNPVRLELLDDDAEEVDLVQYQQLLDLIEEAPSKGYTDIILDAGAGGFRGLRTWLITQNAFGFLQSVGWEIELHYVIPGNGRKAEAYEDLEETLTSFPENQVTVWLNPIQDKCKIDGKDFIETELYRRYKDRIAAIVRLKSLNALFRDTWMRMLQHGMTYEDASAPAATLIDDMRTAMFVEGAKPKGASTALAKMPPGLNDSLAPSRVFTIRQWNASALSKAPGVL